MRVFCPNCSEPINIADDVAGKTTACPLCKSEFTAPALFSSVAPAAPAPTAVTTSAPVSSPPVAPATSYSPTPPPPAPLPSPTTPPRSISTGHTGSIGFSISPEIIQWIAPVALILCVILTFFSWNGAYPGGHAVYTQGPWGALIGSIHYDRVGEKVIQLNPAKAAEGKTRLEDSVPMNLLMWLYLPLLLGTVGLSIFFTLLPKLRVKVPANLARFLPWRMLIVAALVTIITGIVGLQAIRGFGLENTLRAKVKADVKEREKLPDQPSDEDVQKAEINEGLVTGGLNVRQTCSLHLVFALQILAIIGALLTFLMTRRTDRPAPRFEFMW